jgi:hypothetical protein
MTTVSEPIEAHIIIHYPKLAKFFKDKAAKSAQKP